MNDPEYSTYGYESGYATASYQPVGAVYADDDPLFGSNGYPQSWDTNGYQQYQQYPQYQQQPYQQQYQEYPQQYAYAEYQQYAEPTPVPEPVPEPEPAPDIQAYYEPEPEAELEFEPEYEPEPEPECEAEPAAAVLIPSPAGPRSANRSRRRRPAKRSALLTVAVPSVAVMGVAACAAATVTGSSAGSGSTKTRADAATTTATTKLDQQLAGVSRDADDFADRASRTQERIDLKERQATERKKKEAEAIAKEAARPKILLPVTQKGLSAYFGQAGVNWMSVHTGIDFPVSYGTPVMAATDGTVRTQWNSAYGNMAIVTSPDGTETWYCHLSSTKIRSGTVKAGDVIAYSGNSGNSTGPHLHFEVRPAGGAAIDPLQWLIKKGLDPR